MYQNSNGSPRTSPSRTDAGRSQRLEAFLKDKEDGVNMNWTNTKGDGGLTASEREKELDNFMNKVTDKAVIEDAKAAWEKKT